MIHPVGKLRQLVAMPAFSIAGSYLLKGDA